MSNLEVRTLAVDGMTCGHCEATVTTALEGLAGITEAKASASADEVVITLDADVLNEGALSAAIQAAGFELR